MLNRDALTRRLIAAAIVLGVAFGLVSCGGPVSPTGNTSTGIATGTGGGDRGSQFADYVADHWPRWAGGMPEDVPPRPGTPGYNEFITHGQTNAPPAPTATAPGSAAKPAATKTAAAKTADVKTKTVIQPAPAAAIAPAAPVEPVEPVAEEPVENSSVVKGGLY
jgi:hypothetical protein